MKELFQKLYPVILLILIFSFFTKCDKSPTEPEESIPWSKMTGKIAYCRWNEDWNYLFVLDGDEEKARMVKKSKEYLFNNLAWSNDGEKIFFVSGYAIYQINTDGSNLSLIQPNISSYPACSNNGRLAYWHKKNGWPQIWIDGSYFYGEYGRPRCNETRPAWSPNGEFMVISLGDSTSQGALYKVSLSDKSMTPLLQGSGEYNQEIFNCPIYSPDGSKIAYTRWGPSVSNDNSEIWTINSDGSNLTQLTSGFGDWYPAWSPGGERIAFTRHTTGNPYQIYIVNADGSDVTQVTEYGGNYPVWIQ